MNDELMLDKKIQEQTVDTVLAGAKECTFTIIID